MVVQELERAVAIDPQNVEACAVCADALQERGDPMGAVLALHVAVLSEKETARQDELKALLKTKIDEVLGELAQRREEAALEFRLGVLERVRIIQRPQAKWLPSDELLRRILSNPLARFLRHVSVPTYSFQEFLDELPERVSRGELSHVRMVRDEIAKDFFPQERKSKRVATELGPALEPLNLLSETLESLDIADLSMEATGLELPSLKTLRVGNPGAGFVRTLRAGSLPKVERVSVDTMRLEANSQALSLLGELLEKVPTARVLRLTGYTYSFKAELVELLAKTFRSIETYEMAGRPSVMKDLEARFPNIRVVQKDRDFVD